MKLKAENLVKSYKGREVVKGITVEVNRGEIVGLLGPNGAGKTTSFYMIVGLIKPNGGKIFLDNTNITTSLPLLRPLLDRNHSLNRISVQMYPIGVKRKKSQ